MNNDITKVRDGLKARKGDALKIRGQFAVELKKWDDPEVQRDFNRDAIQRHKRKVQQNALTAVQPIKTAIAAAWAQVKPLATEHARRRHYVETTPFLATPTAEELRGCLNGELLVELRRMNNLLTEQNFRLKVDGKPLKTLAGMIQAAQERGTPADAALLRVIGDELESRPPDTRSVAELARELERHGEPPLGAIRNQWQQAVAALPLPAVDQEELAQIRETVTLLKEIEETVDEVEHPSDRPRLTAEKLAVMERGGVAGYAEWLAEQRKQEEARVTTAVKKLLAGHDSALELLNGPADAPSQPTPAPAAAPGNNEVVSQ